jgi:hypothetical protein
MAQKRRQTAGASLRDGFREDCTFVFAAEQRNTAMPVDESRERDAGCQTLDPGVGSTNSESSGQVRSQGHAGPGHEARGRHREMGVLKKAWSKAAAWWRRAMAMSRRCCRQVVPLDVSHYPQLQLFVAYVQRMFGNCIGTLGNTRFLLVPKSDSTYRLQRVPVAR